PSATHPYPLSLHDALPISNPLIDGEAADTRTQCSDAADDLVARNNGKARIWQLPVAQMQVCAAHPASLDLYLYLPGPGHGAGQSDRKSTRLNSSHVKISYA